MLCEYFGIICNFQFNLWPLLSTVHSLLVLNTYAFYCQDPLNYCTCMYYLQFHNCYHHWYADTSINQEIVLCKYRDGQKVGAFFPPYYVSLLWPLATSTNLFRQTFPLKGQNQKLLQRLPWLPYKHPPSFTDLDFYMYTYKINVSSCHPQQWFLRSKYMYHPWRKWIFAVKYL